MFKEFKDFAMRGNVVDMAVGIIIGAAFGAIIVSFVGDVLMPVIGLLPVMGAATPSLTAVLMLKALSKSGAGVKVKAANKVLMSAQAPLAVHTPAAKLDVTAPDVPVFKLPAAAFDRVSVAVRLAWSRSATTISVRFSGVSSV